VNSSLKYVESKFTHFPAQQSLGRQQISKDFDIPTVIIDVDHADVRSYSEANVFLQIEALWDMI
jgi:hypothetical protein